MFTNGMSRVQLIKHDRAFLSFMDVAPPLAIIFTIVMLCLSVFNLTYFWIWLGLGIAYFVTKSIFIAARARGFRYLPLLPFVLLVRELSFGLGILWGIVKQRK